MIWLKELERSDRDEFVSFEKQYKVDCGDETIPFALNKNDLPFDDFMNLIESLKEPNTCPDGFVPMKSYLIKDDAQIVGAICLRYKDNDFILNQAGHIGYGVTPSHRRKGYASEALKLCLFVAKRLGLTRVVLTTDTNNAASQKVIERNGGILFETKGNLKIYRIILDDVLSIEDSAMAVVVYGDKILSTVENVYDKCVLSLPKGHVENGETFIDTAMRECFEETNVELSAEQYVTKLTPFEIRFTDHRGKNVLKTITPILFKVDNPGEPRPKEYRIKKAEYMLIKEFIEKCAYENVKRVVREALDV